MVAGSRGTVLPCLAAGPSPHLLAVQRSKAATGDQGVRRDRMDSVPHVVGRPHHRVARDGILLLRDAGMGTGHRCIARLGWTPAAQAVPSGRSTAPNGTTPCSTWLARKPDSPFVGAVASNPSKARLTRCSTRSLRARVLAQVLREARPQVRRGFELEPSPPGSRTVGCRRPPGDRQLQGSPQAAFEPVLVIGARHRGIPGSFDRGRVYVRRTGHTDQYPPESEPCATPGSEARRPSRPRHRALRPAAPRCALPSPSHARRTDHAHHKPVPDIRPRQRGKVRDRLARSRVGEDPSPLKRH